MTVTNMKKAFRVAYDLLSEESKETVKAQLQPRQFDELMQDIYYDVVMELPNNEQNVYGTYDNAEKANWVAEYVRDNTPNLEGVWVRTVKQ